MTGPDFKLAKEIPQLLGFLRRRYAQRGEGMLADVLGIGICAIEEETFYDNWDGGIYGHDVHVHLPAELFGRVFDERGKLEDRIKEDLNAAHSSSWESVAGVHLELADDPTLAVRMSNVEPSDFGERVTDGAGIWGPGLFRLFVSHMAEHRALAGDIKRYALSYGVSCFVAHDDIEPSEEWQREIERGLASMEGLVALLTPGFHDSHWTDQEVGAAVGRGTVIIPVSLGLKPYGFFGKYQALPGEGKDAEVIAKDIVRLLVRNSRTRARAGECLVAALENAYGYVHANEVMRMLEELQLLDEETTRRIAKAARENSNVQQSWVVRDRLPKLALRFGWEMDEEEE